MAGQGSRGRKAVVVGGGLAGVSAACELTDCGFEVVLVERRPFLGGRTFSFTDRSTGLEVDNGQHLFFRCCTYLIQFLQRLGCLDRTHIQRRMRVPVIGGGGRLGYIYTVPGPAPWNLLPSFLAYRHLGLADKARLLYGMMALRRTHYEHNGALERMTFKEWLEGHGQSPSAIKAIWNLIILPALNAPVEAVSAAQAAMVFHEGFFKASDGANLGFPAVGLGRLWAPEAQAYIEARGGRLVLGREAQVFWQESGRVKGLRLASGEVLEGDVFVAAVPFYAIQGLLPQEWQAWPFFAGPAKLETAPIVNLYLWYDRPVMAQEFATTVDSDLQWVFNRSRILSTPGEGQFLGISLSGAWKYVDMPKEELVALFTREMASHYPRAREARLLHHVVVRERFATFLPSPGSASLRPPQKTPVENLFLAGDWTDTGWPATMESAVRSGAYCAREVVRWAAG